MGIAPALKIIKFTPSRKIKEDISSSADYTIKSLGLNVEEGGEESLKLSGFFFFLSHTLDFISLALFSVLDTTPVCEHLSGALIAVNKNYLGSLNDARVQSDVIFLAMFLFGNRLY